MKQQRGNTEPTSDLLRLVDLQAWQPRLTKYLLRQMEECGEIKVTRLRPGARALYHKRDFVKFCCGTNGHDKAKSESRK